MVQTRLRHKDKAFCLCISNTFVVVTGGPQVHQLDLHLLPARPVVDYQVGGLEVPVEDAL